MPHRARFAGVCLGALPIAALACSSPEVEEPSASSRRVDLYLEDGIEVCGGQLDAYDRFLDRVLERYAPGEADDLRVEVRTRQLPVCEGHSCASDRVAWLARDFGHYHELAHLVHQEVDGRSLTSANEGVATALGPSSPVAFEHGALSEVEPSFLWADELSATEYPYAGAWTRHLIDGHGVDAFRRFFRSFSDGAATGTEYRAVFEEVFARDFESSWSAFLDAKSCAYDDWYCADVEPVSLPAQVGPLDCSDGRTLGYEHVPAEGEASFRPLRVVHVVTSEPSQIQIEMEHATVYFGKCGDCDAQEPELLLTSYDEPGVPPASVDLDLGAGTYALIVRASLGSDTRVSIR